MKLKSLYSGPEILFVVLVMATPVAVGFLFESQTITQLIIHMGLAMVVGFLIWIGIVFLVCKRSEGGCAKDNEKP